MPLATRDAVVRGLSAATGLMALLLFQIEVAWLLLPADVPPTHIEHADGVWSTVFDAGGIHNGTMEVVTVSLLEDLHIHCDPEYINRSVTVRGAGHTMGGQTISSGGIQYDMTEFNDVLEENFEERWVLVEAGITWHALIGYLNWCGFSPKAMQSFSAFTVGGSISVNAHGIAGDMTVGQSVISLQIVTHDCRVVWCDYGSELCDLAIGGYGAAGIIAAAKLGITVDERYAGTHTTAPLDAFWAEYRRVLEDSAVRVRFARLNLYTLDSVDLVTWRLLNTTIGESDCRSVSELAPHDRTLAKQLTRRAVSLMADYPTPFLGIRYEAEKRWLVGAMGDTRNAVLDDDVYPFLREATKTYILQEYFVPTVRSEEWLTFLVEFLKTEPSIRRMLINVTVRRVRADLNSVMTYAPADMTAFVLFFCAKPIRQQAALIFAHWSLSDTVMNLGGTFYLPYLPHYDRDDVVQAYPQTDDYCRLRAKYDPNSRFTNELIRLLCPK